MGNPSDQVSVTFTTKEAEDGGTPDLSIALDTAKNTEVYGESKTTFAPNEPAYLKVLTSSSAAYSLYISATGFISRSGTDIPYDISEDLIFAMAASANLSYTPRQSSMDWDWLGKDPGYTPLFNNKVVSVPEEIVAVLRCDYQTLGDRWKLVIPASTLSLEGVDSLSVAVVVVQGDNSSYCTVTYSTDGGSTPVAVDLEVSDFCSEEVIEGVQVYLDGVSKGTTNSNGRLYLGMLVPGTTYNLKMTKSGYVDSDSDVLYNDSFTISAST